MLTGRKLWKKTAIYEIIKSVKTGKSLVDNCGRRKHFPVKTKCLIHKIKEVIEADRRLDVWDITDPGLFLRCLRQKMRALFEAGNWMFHWDNCSIQKSWIVMEYIEKKGLNVMEHPHSALTWNLQTFGSSRRSKSSSKGSPWSVPRSRSTGTGSPERCLKMTSWGCSRRESAATKSISKLVVDMLKSNVQ